ncbi:hypothetical protein [Cyclobacterium jeungdonense]|uniref:Lipoprotein n=1 Tax=Cyclobacterium jeungdonense TaxID=708087 RepID=A0ABT8CBE0_9BACT|nr:hypothetical protein [Cyclobacterium jeungdonense]MDN3689467.1 hypothetical protein [Cyclobacterium jeungdonense]
MKILLNLKFYFIGLLMLNFACSEIDKPDNTIDSLNLDLSEDILDELSFLMSQAQNGNRNVSIDPQVMACLGVASGVVGVYDLIQNTSALGSVTSITKALKLLGRRAMGWVGVGIMIVDFTTCYYGAA